MKFIHLPYIKKIFIPKEYTTTNNETCAVDIYGICFFPNMEFNSPLITDENRKNRLSLGCFYYICNFNNQGKDELIFPLMSLRGENEDYNIYAPIEENYLNDKNVIQYLYHTVLKTKRIADFNTPHSTRYDDYLGTNNSSPNEFYLLTSNLINACYDFDTAVNSNMFNTEDNGIRKTGFLISTLGSKLPNYFVLNNDFKIGIYDTLGGKLYFGYDFENYINDVCLTIRLNPKVLADTSYWVLSGFCLKDPKSGQIIV